MSGFTVAPAGLSSTAPGWGDQAAAVHDLFTTLTGRLSAEGECWGNDQAGRAFAAKYVGPALATIQYMGATGEGLRSMVDGVAAWARNYVSSDQAVRQDLATQFGA